MTNDKKYRFRINAYTPETIPMARLAEYMTELAVLLGEPHAVHFEGLESGSTQLVARIEKEADPKVRERVRLADTKSGDETAIAAIYKINKMLRADNGDAVFSDESAEIIQFPGVKQPINQVYGPFSQSGTLDGVVIRLGGKTDTVPVMLETREGVQARCRAARGLAKELAKHIFGVEIRCSGTGRWLRDEEGHWSLESFLITSFEVLEQQTITEAVARLQQIKGSKWTESKDPWKALDDLRGDDE